jgi:transposase
LVLKEGCSWRALGKQGISWQTVYAHYRRWLGGGVIEGILQRLDWPGHTLQGIGSMDSSHMKVHRDGSNPAGGQTPQAIGKSRGGSNTKLHVLVSGPGRPLKLILSGGNRHDSTQAEALIEGQHLDAVLADRAYDNNRLRTVFAQHAATTCVPSKRNRKEPIEHDAELFKKRHVVENFFEKIKRCRRVATRYDKLAETFLGFVKLSIIVANLRGIFL